MMTRIDADSATLMDQAPPTIAGYMKEGIACIDGHLGEGYAKKHPELLAAFIQGCAADFGAGLQAQATQFLADAVRDVSLHLGEG